MSLAGKPRKIYSAEFRAKQGDAGAQSVLGGYYLEGTGIAKNPVEAVMWFRKAAEQGHDRAQSLLGTCYYEGIGVATKGDAGEERKMGGISNKWQNCFNLAMTASVLYIVFLIKFVPSLYSSRSAPWCLSSLSL